MSTTTESEGAGAATTVPPPSRAARGVVAYLVGAVAAAALVTLVVWLIVSHHSPSHSTYSSLREPGLSGIQVIQPSEIKQARRQPAGPIWVDVKPSYRYAVVPDASAAREVSHSGQMRLWIAPSDRGGVCLLIYDPALSLEPLHDHTVVASCNARPQLPMGIGQVLGAARPGGDNLVFGLVPDGVRAVTVGLANGPARSVAVHRNLYYLATPVQIRAVSFAGADGRKINQIKIGERK